MPDAPSKNSRTGIGLGLAFLIGIGTFFITFQVIDHFRIPAGERLDPPGQRIVAAALSVPMLNADATGPNGVSWSLQDQKGKVVIVNYFATWCGPCMKEMPDLAAIAQEYAPRGVVTVSISVDHDNEVKEGVTRLQALHEFTQTHPLPFPILLPDAGSAVMKMSFPIPQTLIYDKQGRRARLITGTLDKASLTRSLEELLKEN